MERLSEAEEGTAQESEAQLVPKKKVGGLKGGVKSPTPKSKRVGAIRQGVKETAPCGCLVEYPGNHNGIGTGKPRYIKPCKQHEYMIPLWKADENANKVGGLSPSAISKGTTRGHRQCLECSGRVIDGNWVHSPDCPHVAVLWDFDDSSWRCPFGCEGVRLSTSRTHVWDCLFWIENPDALPF